MDTQDINLYTDENVQTAQNQQKSQKTLPKKSYSKINDTQQSLKSKSSFEFQPSFEQKIGTRTGQPIDNKKINKAKSTIINNNNLAKVKSKQYDDTTKFSDYFNQSNKVVPQNQTYKILDEQDQDYIKNRGEDDEDENIYSQKFINGNEFDFQVSPDKQTQFLSKKQKLQAMNIKNQQLILEQQQKIKESKKQNIELQNNSINNSRVEFNRSGMPVKSLNRKKSTGLNNSVFDLQDSMHSEGNSESGIKRVIKYIKKPQDSQKQIQIQQQQSNEIEQQQENIQNNDMQNQKIHQQKKGSVPFKVKNNQNITINNFSTIKKPGNIDYSAFINGMGNQSLLLNNQSNISQNFEIMSDFSSFSSEAKRNSNNNSKNNKIDIEDINNIENVDQNIQNINKDSENNQNNKQQSEDIQNQKKQSIQNLKEDVSQDDFDLQSNIDSLIQENQKIFDGKGNVQNKLQKSVGKQINKIQKQNQIINQQNMENVEKNQQKQIQNEKNVNIEEPTQQSKQQNNAQNYSQLLKKSSKNSNKINFTQNDFSLNISQTQIENTQQKQKLNQIQEDQEEELENQLNNLSISNQNINQQKQDIQKNEMQVENEDQNQIQENVEKNFDQNQNLGEKQDVNNVDIDFDIGTQNKSVDIEQSRWYIKKSKQIKDKQESEQIQQQKKSNKKESKKNNKIQDQNKNGNQQIIDNENKKNSNQDNIENTVKNNFNIDNNNKNINVNDDVNDNNLINNMNDNDDINQNYMVQEENNENLDNDNNNDNNGIDSNDFNMDSNDMEIEYKGGQGSKKQKLNDSDYISKQLKPSSNQIKNTRKVEEFRKTEKKKEKPQKSQKVKDKKSTKKQTKNKNKGAKVNKKQQNLNYSQVFKQTPYSPKKMEFKIKKQSDTFGAGRYPRRRKYDSESIVEEEDEYIIVQSYINPELNYKDTGKMFKNKKEIFKHEQKLKQQQIQQRIKNYQIKQENLKQLNSDNAFQNGEDQDSQNNNDNKIEKEKENQVKNKKEKKKKEKIEKIDEEEEEENDKLDDEQYIWQKLGEWIGFTDKSIINQSQLTDYNDKQIIITSIIPPDYEMIDTGVQQIQQVQFQILKCNSLQGLEFKIQEGKKQKLKKLDKVAVKRGSYYSFYNKSKLTNVEIKITIFK